MQRVILFGAHSQLAETFFREKVETFSFQRYSRYSDSTGSILPVDYEKLNDSLFETGSTIINFIGVTKGDLRNVNTHIPLALAVSSKRSRVSHFIQISSFSVYGEAEKITLDTAELPISDYGISKYEADKKLLDLSDKDFRVTVIRFPVLYGPNINGKMKILLNFIVKTGIILMPHHSPNRSIIHEKNASEIIAHVIENNLSGVILAADRGHFNLEMIPRLNLFKMRSRIKIIKIPILVEKIVAFLDRSLYNSIFKSKYVCQCQTLSAQIKLPMSIEDGLKQLIEHIEGSSEP